MISSPVGQQWGHRVSLCAFVTTCASFILLTATLVLRPDLYQMISREDALLEYLGAIAFFICAIVLSVASLQRIRRTEPQKMAFVMLLLAALLFLFAAGEEISWGQRIFSINTPELLLRVNQQDEINLHNIDKKLFDRGVRHATTLLVLAGTVLIIMGRATVLGIPVPRPLVICALAMLPAYIQFHNVSIEYHLAYLALIPLLVYAVRHKQHTLLLATMIAAVIIVATIATHISFDSHFLSNNANEARECLLALLCLCYGLQIMADGSTT
jgi:hypothetical protein